MAKMPHSRKWQQSLSGIYNIQKSRILIAQAQAFYEHFCIQHSEQRKKSNQTILKTRVLPGLSIYKALLEENDNQEKVLAEVDILFRIAFFTTLMQGIRLLNFLPNPFPIIKPVLRLMTRDEHGVGSQEIVEDSSDCFAVNVYRCFILDILTEHNAAELTVLYCKTDDWLTESLPKIRWERTKTLGRGDDYCDFRWCRIH